jgi:hypothetical protein
MCITIPECNLAIFFDKVKRTVNFFHTGAIFLISVIYAVFDIISPFIAAHNFDEQQIVRFVVNFFHTILQTSTFVAQTGCRKTLIVIWQSFNSLRPFLKMKSSHGIYLQRSDCTHQNDRHRELYRVNAMLGTNNPFQRHEWHFCHKKRGCSFGVATSVNNDFGTRNRFPGMDHRTSCPFFQVFIERFPFVSQYFSKPFFFPPMKCFSDFLLPFS